MIWKKVDSILVTNFHSYWKNPFVNKYLRSVHGYAPSEKYEGMLLLRKTKKPLWISHPFNHAQARKVIHGAKVVTYYGREELRAILRKNCGKRIGFDARHTAVSTLASLKKHAKGRKFVNISNDIEELMETKKPEEIENIKCAVEETRRVLNNIQLSLRPGIREKEVENLISDEFRTKGFDTAFCIVAFGKNTSNVHHVSGNEALSIESPILIDAGAKWKGYCADLTISFWFGKHAPKKYKETMRKVLDVVSTTEGKMKAGIKAKELFALTKPLGKIPHALGHGLGLEVHDVPSGIGEKSNWKLKKNMVLAIEPGIYTKEFGIRVEHTYVVLEKGTRRL